MSDPEDGTQIGLGFGFAFRGLNQLCKYHSIRDLKTFRTVSQAWNDAISFHPRYRSAKVTLGPRWFREANALQLGHLTSWTNVRLYQFHYSQNIKFFPSVWQICGRNVTELHLRKVKLSCSELNGFLNICPALRSLTIHDMEFTSETAGLVLHPQDNNNVAGVGNRQAIYCSHARYEHPGPEPLLPPTIQHLRFEAMRYFPFCTLDYLAERSRGKLDKFEMENNPPIANGNQGCRPSLVEISARLTRLISENTATLTSFTFFNNATGLEFLLSVGTQIPDLNLIELILGVYDPSRPRPNQAPAQNHHVPPQPNPNPFIQLIQAQLMNRLERLFFKTPFTAQFLVGFGNLGGVMGDLKKLKLSFDGIERDLVFNLDFLAHLRVRELVLTGSLESEGRERNPWDQQPVFPNCQYWLRLPATLRSLECAHRISRLQNPVPPISQALLTDQLNHLTKLVVRDARLFTDVLLHQIIAHLTQLQELTLRYGIMLSEGVFTGISAVLAKSLQECGSYSVLSGADGVTVSAETRSIRDLVRMSTVLDLLVCDHELGNRVSSDLRKLNLTGCSNVSDVSCRYAFTNLHSIDLSDCCHVSDMGLYWLGRNNPGLKEVHLRKNAKVSHFGLNQFLYQLKSVTKVYASRYLLNRQLGSSTYAQHPLLDEIACAASENQVQIAKYRRAF